MSRINEIKERVGRASGQGWFCNKGLDDSTIVIRESKEDEAVQFILDVIGDIVPYLLAEIERQDRVIEKMKDGLKFYANPLNYEDHEMHGVQMNSGKKRFIMDYIPAMCDKGSWGRQALAATENQGKEK